MSLKVSWKHGESQQMWLNSLKIAIVEKDTERLNELMGDIPQLDSLQEREEAFYLIEEAKKMVFGLKDETASSMQQIQKSKDFLKSTNVPQENRLDITS